MWGECGEECEEECEDECGDQCGDSFTVVFLLPNKTPAKAFTPPAKRKWAQNQAGL